MIAAVAGIGITVSLEPVYDLFAIHPKGA
jgi:hypothetical protein